MLRLLQRARERNVGVPSLTSTDYVNTIPTDREPWFPGDEETERALPALDPVERGDDGAPRAAPGRRRRRAHLHLRLLGHASTRSASTTSSAARTTPAAATTSSSRATPPPASTPAPSSRGGCPRTSSTGSARSSRTAARGTACPSYPHPRLMPDFWEFPTVSMGLGPMNAIMQARFNRYLHHRGINDTSDQHVWAFLGDGEMDEPESRGLIHIAAGEALDNLTFVINCNLQRLDGPVRGNGKIIQELEAFFRGAGWNVIKVIWGREWDALLHADRDGALINLMNTTPDGDYQTYKANDGALRPRALLRPRPADQGAGRADVRRRHLEPASAAGTTTARSTRPTRRRWSTTASPPSSWPRRSRATGSARTSPGRNATHQMKKLDAGRPQAVPGLACASRSPTPSSRTTPTCRRTTTRARTTRRSQYMRERRRALGGPVPDAAGHAPSRWCCPATRSTTLVRKGSGKQEVATTMAFVRLLRELVKDKEIGAPVRADHPGRGPHVRDGLDVPDRRRSTTRTGSSTPRWTPS